MSELSREPIAELVAALRAPIPANEGAKRRIMEQVRLSAAPPATPTRRRVGVRVLRSASGPGGTSTSTLVVAAGLVMLLALGVPRGTTTVGRPESNGTGIGDTVAATLRDTMRLVRFVLDAPGAARVSLTGDFNGWDPRATPLVRDTLAGAWSIALRLTPGRHLYAFVVNDTQWVHDPRAPRAEPHELAPPRSMLTVR